MAYVGKTHLTFIFKAYATNVAEGGRLFKSHNAWMQKTHHRSGERALLTYNVSKGAELTEALNPGSAPSGKTVYVLDEIYESPAGIADHWQQAMNGWGDFQAFVA